MYVNTYSKSKKLEYEQARRAKNRVEKQEAQVLKPWLKNKYAAVYAEFLSFYGRLQQAHPQGKNLTVTREFKEFEGMFCIIFCIKLFLRSYIFYFYFIASQQPGYRLFIPSLPILTQLPNVTDMFTLPPAEFEVQAPVSEPPQPESEVQIPISSIDTDLLSPVNEPLPMPSLEVSIPEMAHEVSIPEIPISSIDTNLLSPEIPMVPTPLPPTPSYDTDLARDEIAKSWPNYPTAPLTTQG